jgi:hypothetical protein
VLGWLGPGRREREREERGPLASVGLNRVNERKREFLLFYFLKIYSKMNFVKICN